MQLLCIIFVHMEANVLLRRLTHTGAYDLNFHSELSSDNGNKISIQGKNVNDSIYLYNCLKDYLYKNNIPFKLATIERYCLRGTNKEQSHKSMTIYCPDGYCFNLLCEDIYLLTIGYKGWQDIKTPTSYTHYAGGLFVRNDRDEKGVYIPVKKNKNKI